MYYVVPPYRVARQLHVCAPVRVCESVRLRAACGAGRVTLDRVLPTEANPVRRRSVTGKDSCYVINISYLDVGAQRSTYHKRTTTRVKTQLISSTLTSHISVTPAHISLDLDGPHIGLFV